MPVGRNSETRALLPALLHSLSVRRGLLCPCSHCDTRLSPERQNQTTVDWHLYNEESISASCLSELMFVSSVPGGESTLHAVLWFLVDAERYEDEVGGEEKSLRVVVRTLQTRGQRGRANQVSPVLSATREGFCRSSPNTKQNSLLALLPTGQALRQQSLKQSWTAAISAFLVPAHRTPRSKRGFVF